MPPSNFLLLFAKYTEFPSALRICVFLLTFPPLLPDPDRRLAERLAESLQWFTKTRAPTNTRAIQYAFVWLSRWVLWDLHWIVPNIENKISSMFINIYHFEIREGPTWPSSAKTHSQRTNARWIDPPPSFITGGKLGSVSDLILSSVWSARIALLRRVSDGAFVGLTWPVCEK